MYHFKACWTKKKCPTFVMVTLSNHRDWCLIWYLCWRTDKNYYIFTSYSCIKFQKTLQIIKMISDIELTSCYQLVIFYVKWKTALSLSDHKVINISDRRYELSIKKSKITYPYSWKIAVLDETCPNGQFSTTRVIL